MKATTPQQAEYRRPYEVAAGSGMASTWYSPDGFCKVQEFVNGQRFLHHPITGISQLTPKPYTQGGAK